MSAVRPTLPAFLSQDPLGEAASPSHTPPETHTSPETRTPPETRTHSAPAAPSRQADWLLRDYPYSEGVSEHKQRGACWDCLRFHGDSSDDQPVSGSVAPAPQVNLGLLTLASITLGLQFGLVSPAQGLTWADDLASHDLSSLRCICHIELSAFLHTLGVQSKRTRSRRLRSRGAFRVPAQGWRSLRTAAKPVRKSKTGKNPQKASQIKNQHKNQNNIHPCVQFWVTDLLEQSQSANRVRKTVGRTVGTKPH